MLIFVSYFNVKVKLMPQRKFFRSCAKQIEKLRGNFCLFSLLLSYLFFGLCDVSADELRDAGFLYDHFDLTMAPGHRTEMLGPLFYSEEKETQRSWAVPPILSYTHDPG